MGAIRSLATIAILAAVGAFLYVKINEAPKKAESLAGDNWQQEAPQGIPPLQTSPAPSETPGGFADTGNSAPPRWSDATDAVDAPTFPQTSPPPTFGNAPHVEQAGGGASAQGQSMTLPPMPQIPEMPELPDLSASPGNSAATVPAVAPPANLPANIPTAQYPGSASTTESSSAATGISGRVPSLGTATPDLAAAQGQNGISGGGDAPGRSEVSAMPDNGQISGAQDSGLVPADQAPAGGTMTDPANAAVSSMDDGRYGSAAAGVTDSMGVSSFAAGWPVIQAALERGELARAHLLLSQWYEDPSLTPAESQQVDRLLGQLAGTVVYSTEHRLEPAYVVQPGETLDTIAGKYNVPWQLLAKVNGIPAADQVQPGQELKVVRGPFAAVVELGKGQMTLMLDGRYAGKFPVMVEPAAAMGEGEWIVNQKLATPVSDPLAQTGIDPASAGTAVDRVLVLRGDSPTTSGTTMSIASSSSPPMGPAAGGSAAIRVSPQDAEELADILSVGSRVVIRR